MDVKDALSGPDAAVDRDAEAALRYPMLFGQSIGNAEHLPDQLVIFNRRIEERGDVLTRHDQEMDRRSRIDVLESDDTAVLIDEFALNLAFDNPAEQTVVHRSLPFPGYPPSSILYLHSSESVGQKARTLPSAISSGTP